MTEHGFLFTVADGKLFVFNQRGTAGQPSADALVGIDGVMLAGTYHPPDVSKDANDEIYLYAMHVQQRQLHVGLNSDWTRRTFHLVAGGRIALSC